MRKYETFWFSIHAVINQCYTVIIGSLVEKEVIVSSRSHMGVYSS